MKTNFRILKTKSDFIFIFLPCFINTNKCLISVCESKSKKQLIILSAIDNLIKGGGGQAVQNMNLLFNFKKNNKIYKSYDISRLLKEIKKNLTKNIDLNLIDDYSLNGDYIESQAFGYLAIRSFLNLPISYPKTTGCIKPIVGGKLAQSF